MPSRCRRQQRALLYCLMCGALCCSIFGMVGPSLGNATGAPFASKLMQGYKESTVHRPFVHGRLQHQKRPRQGPWAETQAADEDIPLAPSSSLTSPSTPAVAAGPLAVAGVTVKSMATNAAASIWCVLKDAGGRKRVELLAGYVNDDYCDCADGADEPLTSACAGTALGGSIGFVCTRNVPRKTLPSSQVMDGVCDCCDGSDEGAGTRCPGTCAAMEAQSVKHLAELDAGRAAA